MRIAIALLVAAGVLAVSAPAAQGRSFTIETGKYGVRQLGPLSTRSTPSYAPTVGQARRAFGRPSNLFPSSSSSCVGKWRRLGLRILFASFDSPTSPICGRGIAQSFTIERSRKWRTWKGLRIGMDGAQLERRHPRARWVDDDPGYPDGWWLRSSVSPYGAGDVRTPVLAATVRGGAGRVHAFFGWIGAAGD
jgi:hypothetical protein